MAIQKIECNLGDEISVVKLRKGLKGSDAENHPLLAEHRKWIVEQYEMKETTLYLGKRRKATNATMVRVAFVPKNSPSIHARIRGFWFEDGGEKMCRQDDSTASNKGRMAKTGSGGKGTTTFSPSPPVEAGLQRTAPTGVVVANSSLPDSIRGWVS